MRKQISRVEIETASQYHGSTTPVIPPASISYVMLVSYKLIIILAHANRSAILTPAAESPGSNRSPCSHPVTQTQTAITQTLNPRRKPRKQFETDNHWKSPVLYSSHSYYSYYLIITLIILSYSYYSYYSYSHNYTPLFLKRNLKNPFES